MLRVSTVGTFLFLGASLTACHGQFATLAPPPQVPVFAEPVFAGNPGANSMPMNGFAAEAPAGSVDQSATPVYVPGDGLTIMMLNESSKLKIFANFSNITAFSTTRTFPTAGPLFLLPPSTVNATNGFDIGARQSSIGAMFTGPETYGFTPGAFFLGYIQNDNLTSDAYGFLPFNAYGELKSENWRFSAGLQSDVFNPLAPTMISLIGLFNSGNTGSFRGQMRVEHFYKPNDSFQLTSQFAVSEPTATIVSDNRRIIEDDGIPNLEGRVAAGFGEVRELAGGRKLRPVTVGVSGVVGRLRNATLQDIDDVPPDLIRSAIRVWGIGADLQVAANDRMGFIAEGFLGQSLGEYNGMIGQNFNANNLKAVRGAGGFFEGYYYLNDCTHVHAGYGLDTPVLSDLGPSQIARNQTFYANVFWDITKQLQLSFQVDYRQTDFVTFRDAEGFIFLSQLLFRF